MLNIYLKVTIKKNWLSQNFDFLSLKNCHPDIIESKTSCRNLKIRGLGTKLRVVFLLF